MYNVHTSFFIKNFNKFKKTVEKFIFIRYNNFKIERRNRKMNKKLVALSAVLLIGMVLVSGCGCDKKNDKPKTTEEDGVKVNTHQDVIKDQKLEVFSFTNTSLVYQDGTSTLVTSVTNTSDKTAYLSEFIIHVKNADGTERITLRGFIGSELQAGETRTITSHYGADLTNATKIEYEIKK